MFSIFSNLSARHLAKREISRSRENITTHNVNFSFKSVSDNSLIKFRKRRALPFIIPVITYGLLSGISGGVGLTVWQQLEKLLFPGSLEANDNQGSEHCQEFFELALDYKTLELVFGDGYSIGWTCKEWAYGYMKLRKNFDGDIECGGLTKNSCIIDAKNKQECMDVVPTTELSCGAEHRRIYGHSGYDTDGHWCKTDLTVKYGNDDCRQIKDHILKEYELSMKYLWTMKLIAHSRKITFGDIFLPFIATDSPHVDLDKLFCTSGRSSLEWWLVNKWNWSQNEAVQIRKEFVAKLKDFHRMMEEMLNNIDGFSVEGFLLDCRWSDSDIDKLHENLKKTLNIKPYFDKLHENLEKTLNIKPYVW